MAKGNVRALSAGTEPTSVIDPTIVEAMREAGMDIRGTKPKELTLKMLEQAEKVVTMGCGAEAANIDTRGSWNAFKRPAGRESSWQACSTAVPPFFAAEPDNLGEVVDPGEIVALYEPIISEVDPGLVVQGAELL
jgi:protein-tyrosine-phosphatase